MLEKGEKIGDLIGPGHMWEEIRSPCSGLLFTLREHPLTGKGAPLARIEGQEAFRILLQRFNDFQLEPGELSWNDDFVTRGLERLPIKFKLRTDAAQGKATE